jgi:O-acetyl-ADP-ribose deacetylase (regulator of RNase III)
VGPWFSSENEEHSLLFLTGAYRSALELAKEYRLEAVAFSLIGCSCRGGDRWKETVAIGLNTIIHYNGYPQLKEIHLFGFTTDEANELSGQSMEATTRFKRLERLPLDDEDLSESL